MVRRWKVIAGTGVVAAALALATLGSSLAQTPTPTPRTTPQETPSAQHCGDVDTMRDIMDDVHGPGSFDEMEEWMDQMIGEGWSESMHGSQGPSMMGSSGTQTPERRTTGPNQNDRGRTGGMMGSGGMMGWR